MIFTFSPNFNTQSFFRTLIIAPLFSLPRPYSIINNATIDSQRWKSAAISSGVTGTWDSFFLDGTFLFFGCEKLYISNGFYDFENCKIMG